MLKIVTFAALAGTAFLSTAAFGAQQTATIGVTATIAASCTIATSPLSFGSMTTTNSGNTDVSTTVQVVCSSDSPFNIGIDSGLNAAGLQRRMASGGHTLNYSIFVDGFGLTEFGAISTRGTSNNYNSPASGNAGTNTITIYGRIPQQTTPAAGVYSDTLTVTVAY